MKGTLSLYGVNNRRYRSGSDPQINIMNEIDENAFGGGSNVEKETMPIEEDLVDDDVPFNLAFVESYYGDQSKLKGSPSSSRSGQDRAEEQGDKLLAEGKTSVRCD
jgi:hypothetical protein